MAYPFTILVYSIFRFIIEWFREEYTGQVWIFHLAHIWSLISIIGSAIAIYLIKRHYKNNEKPHSKHKAVKKEVD
jgi:prolipoprotein diacylglyceryltransferase